MAIVAGDTITRADIEARFEEIGTAGFTTAMNNHGAHAFINPGSVVTAPVYYGCCSTVPTVYPAFGQGPVELGYLYIQNPTVQPAGYATGWAWKNPYGLNLENWHPYCSFSPATPFTVPFTQGISPSPWNEGNWAWSVPTTTLNDSILAGPARWYAFIISKFCSTLFRLDVNGTGGNAGTCARDIPYISTRTVYTSYRAIYKYTYSNYPSPWSPTFFSNIPYDPAQGYQSAGETATASLLNSWVTFVSGKTMPAVGVNRYSLTQTTCHSSCHSSCYGARGRR